MTASLPAGGTLPALTNHVFKKENASLTVKRQQPLIIGQNWVVFLSAQVKQAGIRKSQVAQVGNGLLRCNEVVQRALHFQNREVSERVEADPSEIWYPQVSEMQDLVQDMRRSPALARVLDKFEDTLPGFIV
jgi:hypothetical protein